MTARLTAGLLCVIGMANAACSSDDDGGGEIDAPMCDLPPTAINCTAGDDTPCTDTCAVAYCYTFGGGGGGGTGTGSTICTQNCTTAADCPEGWSCNMMGRCRNP